MSNQRVKVLLVEDNLGDARLIQELLAEAKGDSFDLETADRLASGLRRLSAGGIDAVLLDLALPDSKGWDTFVKAKAQAPGVPIIILTGLGDEMLALTMVQQGAQDCLAKVDLNGSVLSRAIRYAIEREHTKQQIRSLNEELEERVRQRTAELEAANRELEAFSYSVSHDLRGPLHQIDGFCYLLSETCGEQLGPQGDRHLRRIREGVRRMVDIIEALLKLSRVGREKLNAQTTSLGALVREVVADLAMESQGRQIDWRIAALPLVECDPGLMKQVFSNLLGNALKYTRPREVAVIEIGEGTREGKPVIFVRDNGTGFDMRQADKLFQAFQRLHRQEDFEGTGIGLATVRRIIQRHGGRIWAEAKPEKGATFYFTLGAEGRELSEVPAGQAGGTHDA